MQGDARFRETYLALVALIWHALERIDQLLVQARNTWATPLTEGRLQWLRLELLQLRGCAAHCRAAQRLSGEQLRRIQDLVATLLEWLDFDAATSTEIARLRLGAAQNWLLDEAVAWGQDNASSESTRKRG
jgi:hypothetical protein